MTATPYPSAPRRLAARLAAVVASPLLLVATLAVPAAAAPAVTCRYTFTAWPGGFIADLSITNNGPVIDGWTARWTFDVPATSVVGWSAALTLTDGVNVRATNLAYNAVIRTGQTTTFGWSATAPSTTAPTDLSVNGVPC